MMQHRPLRKLPALVAGWLVPLSISLTSCQTHAQGVRNAEPLPTPIVSEARSTLTLAECIQLSLQRQPRLSVERANLAASEDGKRALDKMRLPALVEREIPVRRKQACLGVSASAAGLDLAERDTVYAVTRAYITVLFAREQERIAQTVVERLSATHETAQQALKQGARDVTTSDVNRVLVYLRQAQAKRVQAAQGAKRALASLKEAIGLCPEDQIDILASRLPDPMALPSKEEVVALALSRRGDFLQANIFAQITCLEVEAQGTSLLLRKETFAAGSDIHSTQVPQGAHNPEYRPGAIPPAMPTMLAGSRSERIKHAESLHARAAASVEVTRGLVALEAEDAFLRWQEASLQVPPAREAAEAGDKLADDLTRDYTAGLKVRTDEVVTARVLAAQARATYNEYLYHKILTLADLERITAGGFCARLTDVTMP